MNDRSGNWISLCSSIHRLMGRWKIQEFRSFRETEKTSERSENPENIEGRMGRDGRRRGLPASAFHSPFSVVFWMMASDLTFCPSGRRSRSCAAVMGGKGFAKNGRTTAEKEGCVGVRERKLPSASLSNHSSLPFLHSFIHPSVHLLDVAISSSRKSSIHSSIHELMIDGWGERKDRLYQKKSRLHLDDIVHVGHFLAQFKAKFSDISLKIFTGGLLVDLV